MSAIFGIINKNGAPVTHEMAGRFSAALKHRTPDSLSVWQEKNVMIGHCKQITTDTELFTQQPLVTDHYIIAADMQLDERDVLLRLAGAPSGASDPELILYAFLKWGTNCSKYIKGEYTWCIWDRKRSICILSTDHIGFRSLFYYESPEAFIFSSKQAGILAVKPTPYIFNSDSILEYLFRQSDPSSTYNQGVNALPGGSTLTLQHHVSRIERYWDPAPGKYHFKKPDEWTACLRELLFRAVEKRIPAGQPVGVTLSGGLDSSSITCILAKLLAQQNQPLYAFSSVLPDDYQGHEQDERKYIEMITKHCPNIVQTFVTAPGTDPLTNVIQAFETDESFPNIFHYIDTAILEAAREKKIGMLFTGYGGDHWVSWKGNPVIHRMIAEGRLKEAIEILGEFRKTEQKGWLHLIKREYAAHTGLYNIIVKYFRKRGKMMEKTVNVLQKQLAVKYKAITDQASMKDIVRHMTNNIRSGRTGMIPAMLDKRNQHFGMRSAVPLLDRDIMEFMQDVPLHLFVRGGYKRSLLRHAMEGILPAAVQWRQDKGPYSPDYVSRIKNVPDEMIIQRLSPGNAAGRYIAREKLLIPLAGRDVQSAIMKGQLGIICTVMNVLQEKGYTFVHE